MLMIWRFVVPVGDRPPQEALIAEGSPLFFFSTALPRRHAIRHRRCDFSKLEGLRQSLERSRKENSTGLQGAMVGRDACRRAFLEALFFRS